MSSIVANPATRAGEESFCPQANPESALPMDRIGELYHGQIMAEETAEIARKRIHWICSQCVGETVLDVGCSQGITAILLAREGMQVTGVDTHSGVIRYAIQATEREIASVQARLRWIQGDLSHEALHGRQFDTLVLGEVIEHQAMPERFLMKALRFAREGTRIVLTTPFGLHPHPDHKVELFPRHLASFSANGSLVVESLDVIDGYMRLVACVRRQGDGGQVPAADALLVTTEHGALASQAALYDRLRERGEVVKKLQSSQKLYQRKAGELADEANAARQEAATYVSELAKARSALTNSQDACDTATQRAQALTAALKARQVEVDTLQDDLTVKSQALDTLRGELTMKSQALDTLQGELSAKTQVLDTLQLRSDLPSEDAALIASISRSCLLHESRRAEANHRAAAAAAEFVGLGVLLSSSQADAVRRSFSFQLGNSLLESARSWRRLIRLPLTLARQYGEASRRRRLKGQVPANGEVDRSGELLAVFEARGLQAFAAALTAQDGDQAARARAFARLAEQLRSTQASVAECAARQAYVCDPTPSRAKWLAFRLHDAGHISEPLRLLESLPHDLPIAEPEKRRWTAIRNEWLATQLPAAFTVVDKPSYNGRDDVIVVIGDEQAAGRAGEQLRGLNAAALKPRCEFALIDFAPEAVWPPLPKGAAADGVPTGAKSGMSRRPTEKVLDRLLASAVVRAGRALEREVRTRGAGAIVVAFDSPQALPALWASQRLGVALVCQVNRAVGQRSTTEEGSQRKQARDAFVLNHADLIIAATQVLAWQCRSHLTRQIDVIVPRWAASSSVAKVPPRDVADAVSARPLKLGFYGDLSSHSGAAQLLHAVAQAKKRGVEISLKIAGSGSQRTALQAAAARLKLSREIEFLGARTEEQACADLAGSHAVVFPAVPNGLDDLVAPSAFDWFANNGHWVIASDLPAHLEATRRLRNVITLEAGNRRHLADAIVALHRGAPTLPARGGETLQTNVPLADLALHLRRAIASKLSSRSARVDDVHIVVSTGSSEERAKWSAIFRAEGAEGVIAQLAPKGGGHAAREASEIVRVAKVLREAGHPEAEFPLARAAAEHHRNAFTLQALFWSAQRAKQFGVSCTVVRQLEETFGPKPDAHQKALLERFRRSPVTMLDVVAAIDINSIRPIEPISGRVCYVLHNTLPYTSGGYATRSHGIATGLKAIGWDVVVLSRPGYPADLKPEGEMGAIAPVDLVDDISYVRTLSPRRRPGLSSRDYVLEAAAALEQRIREQRPALVMAASNYITALPALIAARLTGVPFVYDVRGFWEITRLSRESDYEKNPNYEAQRLLEALVAKEANHVFTLTEPMREELTDRGVPREKIDLFPNSCDPTKFHARLRDATLAASLAIPDGVPVIGYIGTFVDYEGLDDLTEACGYLKRDGIEFRLLLVGNENTSGTERGPIMQCIQRLAEDAGFASWLIMPGRIPHEQVEAHYSLVDIAPFPRKPWPVCEMVSPMKPLEAMAMEKAVLVSSVRALREMVRDEQTGLVFEKGNTLSLANVLKRLITDKDLRATLGKASKQWVEQERSWARTTERFTERCNELFGFRVGRH